MYNRRENANGIAEEALRAAQSILTLSKRGRVEPPRESSAEEEEEGEDDENAEELEEARTAITREEDSVDTRRWSA